jgi:hypothetical protein
MSRLVDQIVMIKAATEGRSGMILGGHVPGNGAGILIDGVVTPLSGEPPIAQTKGWGRVPGA